MSSPAESIAVVSRAASRRTLPVVLTGVALVAMSISGTAIALPSIGTDLETAGSALNWAVAGYNLAFAAMTLVAGAAADRAGRRRVFVIAAALFTGGFLATAFAPTIEVLDAARIVSGIGGAGVMAAGGALLASAYDGAALNRAFALMGTMAGVGIATGPTLVGGLVDLTGWRGSFGVFAGVAAIIAGAATRLAESRDERARTDWIGSGLFVATLTAVMFALLEGPGYGWGHPMVIAGFGVGIAGSVVFAVAQRRSSAPVLAPELVGNRRFMAWCLATLTTSIGFLGVLVFLPTYLQAAAGHNPVTAGLVMLLLTAPVLVTPIFAAMLVNRGSSPRFLIMIALILVVAGNVGLLVLRPENTTVLVAIPLLLIGIGMGASFGITDGQAMALVPARLVGTAAGFLNTLRAAEALVIAGFSAALLGFLTSALQDSQHAADVAAGHLTTANDPGRAVEIDAFTSSWHRTQLGVGALCLLLTAAVALLVFTRSHGKDTHIQEA
ncbi:MFS transporter [Kribbella hippodromi]|uniref:MFS transporter n=1 Tax=Kribbella hippodromi TaxID=434347 RepID=A0ABN2CMC5_9ACTN